MGVVTISQPTKVRWFATRARKPGPARAALDQALADRPDLPGSRRIVAELARSAADLTDSARRQQDPRLWLSAAQRLLGLVAQLGLDASAVPGESGDDRGDGDGGIPAGLADALGAGPSVGDPEES